MIQHNGQFFWGIIEDRSDPLKIGRTKVRVAGLHTHDKSVLPTSDLPWAMLMQPCVSGTAISAIGPAEGSSVIVIFADYPQNQQPIVIGVIGGIPQGNPVTIDQFESTPLFKDNITPAGRKIPTNDQQVHGYHIGPITERVETPVLNQIVLQGQHETSNTGFGVIQNVLSNTSRTMGATGGLLGSIGGIGSTYGLAKTTFSDLLIGTGSRDSASERFINMATQSGPLGNAISAVFNGKATLREIGKNLNLSLDNITSSFSAIKDVDLKNPGDMLTIITAAEQLSGFIAGGSGDLSGLVGGLFGELSNVSLQGTVGGLLSDVGDFSSSGIGELVGVISPALTTIQSVFGGGPGQYSTFNSSQSNIGNINVLKTTPTHLLSSSVFASVGEGTTPPLKGVYGGPNYKGASPVLVPPTQDNSRYAGGSKSALKTSAPPNWRGDRSAAETNIALLISACKKYGLSTNEQQASLLAIVGGECGWIPVEENCQYSSPERLNNIFKTTFQGDLTLAKNYCNWIEGNKGPSSEFFNFVYDPANNGRQLGNNQPGDGGKYFGRGFIQLTGRSNYQRYSDISGHDLISNPDLLISNPQVSAEVAVLYLMDRVKNAVPTAHPGYFYAAKSAVGNNSPQGSATKLAYYEHFYGITTPENARYADRQAGNTEPLHSFNGALTSSEDRNSANTGFRDPHGKYPLKQLHNEPETSRLARGQINETIVMLKESKRTTGIPIAFDGGEWHQPNSPFGAVYPFNHVRETESGHVQEFDDTPGYERIHTYHRSGTFEEIDALGTKVTKIVGDDYIIIDRNGFISILGEANVTIGGNINVFCRSDANIEVSGSAELKVGGSLDVGVARDMNIAVEGNFSLWANGNINLQASKKGHILTNDNLYLSSSKQIHAKSTEDMFVQSNKNLYCKTTENFHLQTTLDLHLKSSKNVFVTSLENIDITSEKKTHLLSLDDFHIKTPKNMFINSEQNINIKSTNNVEIDGDNINLNSNTAQPADNGIKAVDSQDTVKALINGMVPPPLGTPLYPPITILPTPELIGEEKFMYELPEDGRVGASKTYNQELVAQQGKTNMFSSNVYSATGSGGTIVSSVSVNTILNTSEFTGNFKLSEHFTLAMLFDGGFNIKHKLVGQNDLTPQQIVANLANLCENILEKYLDVLPNAIAGYGKTWRITSGYRMGTSISDHNKGRACDIQLIGRSKEDHFNLVKQLDSLVSYDQLILEYAGPTSVWIHTGFKGDGTTTFGGGSNRLVAFTMLDHKKYSDQIVLLG